MIALDVRSMNQRYLNDAYDLVKLIVLRLLRRQRMIKGLVIAPCLTTPLRGRWYGHWLGPPAMHYRRSDWLRRPYRAYVDGLTERLAADWRKYDIFLDPNTGLGIRRGPRHVGYDDIVSLLSDGDRVVACYQHAWHDGKWAGFAQAENLRRDHGLVACAYSLRVVGIVFASRNKGRIDKLRDGLSRAIREGGLVGRVA